MKMHRALGIVLGLLGAACDGDEGPAGAQGDMGTPGVQGVQGVQGIQGIQGIQGDPGDTTVTLESGDCQFTSSTPSPVCTVTCAGVGAIAMARGTVTVTPQPLTTGTFDVADSGQDSDDPATYTFSFQSVGAEGTFDAAMSIVCFTPPG